MVMESVIDCTGCGCCAAFCPSKCLSMAFDTEKFYHPKLADLAKCTNCNLCDRICPTLNTVVPQNTPEAFSVIAKNEEELMSVTSGGAAFELAKIALAHGYKVCAVTYNYDKHMARHIIIDSMEELEESKGSKYMQSYTADAFSQLLDGSKYMVFGTPCQISGIEKIASMKNMRDNFLLVDFFCHGTPSMKLWEKYIAENGGAKIKKIHFRSKEKGWHTLSIKFHYKDGTSYTDAKRNLFYTFFLGDYCLNNSCYNCSFKSLSSAADIRVGDFWGRKFIDVDTGVSSVLAFTESALRFIEKLRTSCKVNNETIDETIDNHMLKSPLKPKCREFVLKSFDSSIDLIKIYNICLFPIHVLRKIRSLIKADPKI